MKGKGCAERPAFPNGQFSQQPYWGWVGEIFKCPSREQSKKELAILVGFLHLLHRDNSCHLSSSQIITFPYLNKHSQRRGTTLSLLSSPGRNPIPPAPRKPRAKRTAESLLIPRACYSFSVCSNKYFRQPLSFLLVCLLICPFKVLIYNQRFLVPSELCNNHHSQV